ncbi:MAG: hypothetical protein IPL65_01845 [Lewinellaceae bacterium]|nr:hypothetical protein [Lewinellaceae bacterium]
MLQRLATLFATPKEHPQRLLFLALALATVAALWGAVATERWWLMGIPAALLLAWAALVDFQQIYFLMLGCIPISIEMELPGGLGTDLPSEPLMWLLTLSSVLWF